MSTMLSKLWLRKSILTASHLRLHQELTQIRWNLTSCHWLNANFGDVRIRVLTLMNELGCPDCLHMMIYIVHRAIGLNTQICNVFCHLSHKNNVMQSFRITFHKPLPLIELSIYIESIDILPLLLCLVKNIYKGLLSIFCLSANTFRRNVNHWHRANIYSCKELLL